MSEGLYTSPRISVEDRAERQRAVDFARGSVCYEGFVLDDETERLFALYIAGHLDRPGLNAAILQYCGISPAIGEGEPHDADQQEPASSIDADERGRRQRAIDFARGSCRLEGLIPSPEAERINQRFIDGELTMEEAMAAVGALG